MNAPPLTALSLVFDYVLRASLLGNAAIALVFLIRWTLGRRLAPGARSWLWLPVVVLCLSPQLPGLVDWGFHVEPLPSPEQEATVVEREPVAVMRGEPRLLSEAPEPIPSAPLVHLTLKEKMALGWVAGGCTILVFWMVAYAGLWRRIRREQIPVSEDLAAEYQVCARLAGFQRAPQLMVSAAVESPAVAGLWRPVVLMPPHLATSLGDEALRHVLLHELTHLRRKDLWLHWASALVVALHWFNPFVWLASRKFRGDREAACDATVIRLGENHAHAYGQTLLALESRVTQPVALRLMAGVLGGADLVRQRIVDIAHLGKTSRRAGGLAFAATVGGAAVIALAAAEPVVPKVEPPKSADSKPANPSSALFTRTYKVPPDFPTWNQPPAGAANTENTAKATAIEVLKGLGVPFPEGGSAAFIPSSSLLIVRNTQANLDLVEAIVEGMVIQPAKQVYIRTHLVVFKEGTSVPTIFGSPAETPEKPASQASSEKTSAQKDGAGPLIVQHPVAPPESSLSLSGVFTAPQFQFLLKSLMGTASPPVKDSNVSPTFPINLASKVEAVIGLPSVTTRSGHRATLETTREFFYPTEFDKNEPAKQGESAQYVPKAFEMRPIGFRMEVDPAIGADGYTLDLNLAPELQAFMGWVDAPVGDGGKVRQPTFHRNTMNTAVTIWDDQTVAFGGQAYVAAFLMNPSLKGEEALVSKKYPVMIFVTATMIDPSGKPVKKNEAQEGEKATAPGAAPVPTPPASTPKKADASSKKSTGLARLQFYVKKPDSGELDREATAAFTEAQLAILLGRELRMRAAKQVEKLHPDIKPVAVSLGIARLPETGQVIIEASGVNDAYVRHLLNCLLDEMMVFRKEAAEKRAEGDLGKIIQQVLTLQKKVSTLVMQHEHMVKSGAPKEEIDKVKVELDRVTESHRQWREKLQQADKTFATRGTITIPERPAPVEKAMP